MTRGVFTVTPEAADMSKKTVRITDHFCLKPSKHEWLLINLKSGEQYNLTFSQYRLLKMLDGNHTIHDLVDPQVLGNQIDSRLFLSELLELEAVKFTSPGEEPLTLPAESASPNLQIVHWEITKRCNLNCKHCLQEIYLESDNEELTYDEVCRIVDEMYSLNVHRVSISGGEPFLRDDLTDILRYIESKKINLWRIFTNGGTLTKQKIAALKERNSRLELVVSFDGFTKEDMALRNISDGTISRILDGIEAGLCSKIAIAINTCVHKYNVNHLLGMYHRLKKLGVKRWRLGPPMILGRYKGTHNLFDPNTETLFCAYTQLLRVFLNDVARARDGGSKSYMDVQIDGIFRLETFQNFVDNVAKPIAYMCDYDGKLNSICIKPTGEVTPCSEQVDNVVGNLKQSTLTDIWYSPKCQNEKRIRICEIPECVECSMVSFCGGGCRANIDTTGSCVLRRDKISCLNMIFVRNSVIPLLGELGWPI